MTDSTAGTKLRMEAFMKLIALPFLVATATACTTSVSLDSNADAPPDAVVDGVEAAPEVGTPDVTASEVGTPDITASEVGAPDADSGGPSITVAEGDTVIPQTVLHLSATWVDGGGPSEIAWSVDQPVGSQSVFQPSADVASPRFEANVAGTYTFHAQMRSHTGESYQRSFMVFVAPTDAIHVELLWHTPNDPNETNVGPVAGADLDLHFAHPQASSQDVDGDGQPDPWFDNQFDCFWFNPNPNWAGFDDAVDDDPALDRDDTDGAGPENLNLAEPEVGACYRVGVHYWSDHAFGPSIATVRIYILGELAYESPATTLARHDLWRVGRVCWVGGDATIEADGAITADYVHPMFAGED
ncbi:MAG: hypothetical protein U1F43_02955 [Myxococcota bacterium]